MIKIDKIDTDFGSCFRINTDDGVFDILFMGNFDLYWRYCYSGNILQTDDEKTFYITKENYYLFSLFDDLYNNVKNYKVFSNDIFNEELKIADKFNDVKLFVDDKIEWYSDDFDYEDASVLRIERLLDCYKVTFVKSKDRHHLTYSVRFRNSRSRYHPFNILFMNMYLELCSNDFSYYQIHMEEYLYNKNSNTKKLNLRENKKNSVL